LKLLHYSSSIMSSSADEGATPAPVRSFSEMVSSTPGNLGDPMMMPTPALPPPALRLGQRLRSNGAAAPVPPSMISSKRVRLDVDVLPPGLQNQNSALGSILSSPTPLSAGLTPAAGRFSVDGMTEWARNLITPDLSRVTSSNRGKSPGTAVPRQSPTPSRRQNLSQPGASPSTSGSNTGANSSVPSRFILSVVEFRNRQLVGIAAIDLGDPRIYIAQYADNPIYTTTSMLINQFDPVEILVSDTAVETTLYRIIREEFQLAQIQHIRRKYFNESLGLELLERTTLPSDFGRAALDSTKYLCLAAAGCLLKYVECIQHMSWAPKSLSLQQSDLNGLVQIDAATARALELVPVYSRKPVTEQQRATTTTMGPYASTPRTLFDVLNYTRTRSGARLLRATILQPLTDVQTIRIRQASIATLLNNENLFFQISTQLSAFKELDTVLNSIVKVPRMKNVATIQNQALQLMLLHRILTVRHELAESCRLAARMSQSSSSSASAEVQSMNPPAPDAAPGENAGSQSNPCPQSNSSAEIQNGFFAAIADTVADEIGDELIKIIDTVIDPQITSAYAIGSKSQTPEQMRIQVVYSVRRGLNSVLDVARETFSSAIEAIHAEAQRTIAHYGLRGARLQFTSARGYCLSVPSTLLSPDQYVDEFVGRVYRGSRVLCTTRNLQSLNARQQEAYEDSCFFTSQVLEEVTASQLRPNLAWLHSMAEATALLDLICSFACVASLNEGYVAPQILPPTEVGTLAIKQGRHPVLDTLQRSCVGNSLLGPGNLENSEAQHMRGYIANDSFITQERPLVIVTGPNNSGKSTYLRQLGVLTVMAHTGSFIPAEFAAMRVVDRIATCFSSDVVAASNSLGLGFEKNSSSFYLEMAGIARHILSVTSRSLMLIDELGRSTSSVDGTSIAWAICEAFRELGSFTVFATHALKLPELAKVYPSVQNLCFRATIAREETSPVLLHFDYKLRIGSINDASPGAEQQYGIAIAAASRLPSDVIASATSYLEKLQPTGSNERVSEMKTKALYETLDELLQLNLPDSNEPDENDSSNADQQSARTSDSDPKSRPNISIKTIARLRKMADNFTRKMHELAQ